MGNAQIREIAENFRQITGPIDDSDSYLNQIKDVLAQNGVTDVRSFVHKIKWYIDRYNNILLVKSCEICGPDDTLVKLKALKVVVENFLKGIDFDRSRIEPYSIFCAVIFTLMIGKYFSIEYFFYINFNFILYVSVIAVFRIFMQMNSKNNKKIRS